MRRLSDVLKNEYHEKVYKLSLSTGCTCPNRDGTVGWGGCSFCSEGGSGEFAAQARGLVKKDGESGAARTGGQTEEAGPARTGGQTEKPGEMKIGGQTENPGAVKTGGQTEEAGPARTGGHAEKPGEMKTDGRREKAESVWGSRKDDAGGGRLFVPDPEAEIDRQIREAKAKIAAKTDARLFIAYFQSFTNTYGDPDDLGSLFRAAISRDEVVILSIGTRPDCISDRMLEILAELNKMKPVWLELGLQTAHDRTAERLNRGYPRTVFEDCVRRLKAVGITVIVHVIFSLPGETREDMLETIRYLARVKPDGIKIQMLQVLKGTRLAAEYEAEPFPLFTLEEYADLVAESVRILPADMVLHRMTGDGPRRLLIAPKWCLDKKRVLNTMNARLKGIV